MLTKESNKTKKLGIIIAFSIFTILTVTFLLLIFEWKVFDSKSEISSSKGPVYDRVVPDPVIPDPVVPVVTDPVTDPVVPVVPDPVVPVVTDPVVPVVSHPVVPVVPDPVVPVVPDPVLPDPASDADSSQGATTIKFKSFEPYVKNSQYTWVMFDDVNSNGEVVDTSTASKITTAFMNAMLKKPNKDIHYYFAGNKNWYTMNLNDELTSNYAWMKKCKYLQTDPDQRDPTKKVIYFIQAQKSDPYRQRPFKKVNDEWWLLKTKDATNDQFLNGVSTAPGGEIWDKFAPTIEQMLKSVWENEFGYLSFSRTIQSKTSYHEIDLSKPMEFKDIPVIFNTKVLDAGVKGTLCFQQINSENPTEIPKMICLAKTNDFMKVSQSANCKIQRNSNGELELQQRTGYIDAGCHQLLKDYIYNHICSKNS